MNALKAMVPALDTSCFTLPRCSLDIGDGYAMLTATQSSPTSIRPCEAAALHNYLSAIDPAINPADFYKVMRWARILLPNGQIARSLWKEANIPSEKIQTARNVKVSSLFTVYILKANTSLSSNQPASSPSWRRYIITWYSLQVQSEDPLRWPHSMDPQISKSMKILTRHTYLFIISGMPVICWLRVRDL